MFYNKSLNISCDFNHFVCYFSLSSECVIYSMHVSLNIMLNISLELRSDWKSNSRRFCHIEFYLTMSKKPTQIKTFFSKCNLSKYLSVKNMIKALRYLIYEYYSTFVLETSNTLYLKFLFKVVLFILSQWNKFMFILVCSIEFISLLFLTIVYTVLF